MLLKQNQQVVDPLTGETEQLRNGRRAVVEGITPAGDLLVGWDNNDQLQRGLITAADIEEGTVVPGYVNRGQLLRGASATTHSTQGGTLAQAVVVGARISSPELAYTALSRDEERVDLVLDVESLARTPEDAAWLTALPEQELRQEATRRWVADITSHGPTELRTLHKPERDAAARTALRDALIAADPTGGRDLAARVLRDEPAATILARHVDRRARLRHRVQRLPTYAVCTQKPHWEPSKHAASQAAFCC